MIIFRCGQIIHRDFGQIDHIGGNLHVLQKLCKKLSCIVHTVLPCIAEQQAGGGLLLQRLRLGDGLFLRQIRQAKTGMSILHAAALSKQNGGNQQKYAPHQQQLLPAETQKPILYTLHTLSSPSFSFCQKRSVSRPLALR